MTGRFIEDGPMFPPAPTDSPATAAPLLSQLGTTFRPVQAQRQVLARWICSNHVPAHVMDELVARGLVTEPRDTDTRGHR